MMMKDSLFPAYFKCFRKGVLGWGEGPVVVMKDSLILLILNVLGRECGARRGPLMMMKESLFLLVSNVLGSGCGAGEGAH